MANFIECYVPYPQPIQVSIASAPVQMDERLSQLLNRDLPRHGHVFEFSPETQKLSVPLKKGKYLPRRMFFVAEDRRPTKGSLWMVSGHFEGEAPTSQVIASGLDRSALSFVTDGNADARQRQLGFDRIAVVDHKTRIGPTYVSRSANGPFVRYEYDSDYVKREWEMGECRSRPLTAIPRKWVEERNRQAVAAQTRK